MYYYDKFDLFDDTVNAITSDNKDARLIQKLLKKLDIDDCDLSDLLYVICIEQKEYKLAEKLSDSPCLISYECMELYNSEKRDKTELNFINSIDYYFSLYPEFHKSLDSQVEIFCHPIYHLLKNKCYNAINAFLDKAELFNPDKTIMSSFIRIAIKNRDADAMELFFKRNYILDSFDMAYLILKDNDYMKNTVIPEFYSGYLSGTADNDTARELYMKLFSDSERFMTYLNLNGTGQFTNKKLLYCHDNLLNIRFLDITDKKFYIPLLKDSLKISPDVCSYELTINIYNCHAAYQIEKIKNITECFSDDISIHIVFKTLINVDNFGLYFNNREMKYLWEPVMERCSITFDTPKSTDMITDLFDMNDEQYVRLMIKCGLINAGNCKAVKSSYIDKNTTITGAVLNLLDSVK